jgi:hypothetical protein
VSFSLESLDAILSKKTHASSLSNTHFNQKKAAQKDCSERVSFFLLLIFSSAQLFLRLFFEGVKKFWDKLHLVAEFIKWIF